MIAPRAIVLAVAAAVVVAAAGPALVGCGGAGDGGDETPGVPDAWREARSSPGHVVHVTYEGVPCRDCHDDGGFAAPPADVCARCHDDVASPLHEEHGRNPAGGVAPACQDCHGFAAGSPARPWGCMRCHDQPQGAFVAAVGAHQGEACGSCHRPHQSPSLAPRACADCHSDQLKGDVPVPSGGVQAPAIHPTARRAARELSRGGKHGNQTLSAASCLGCHRTHEPALAAGNGCVNCHSTQRRPVGGRALFAGHDQCTTCHLPHRFAAAEVRACRDCHAGVRVIAAASHGACASCHQPHQAAAARTCRTCHREAVKHPSPTPGDACLGCHPVHPGGGGGSVAVACTTCHRKPGHGTATCRDCHQPHAAAPKADGALCGTCHVEPARRAAGTGHTACANCHVDAAHGPSRSAPACATCHAAQATASSHGAARAGHGSCTACHTGGPHAPATAPPACATCHPVPAKTAPRGHQRCTDCHQSHAGDLRPGTTCATCHRDQAARGHGTRGACDSCHRPHGPGGPTSPPTCTSCHPADRRPGLHRGRGHDRCETCHTSHEQRPKSDRATCVTCHKDRVDHEPGAASCGACHPFGDGR